MTSVWHVLVAVALFLTVSLGSYSHGVSVEEARGAKALADLEAAHARTEAVRHEVAQDALTKAQEIAAKALREAHALEAELLAAQDEIETLRKQVSRRIPHAAKAAAPVCSGLPAVWVREYNLATAPGPGVGVGAGPDGTGKHPGGLKPGAATSRPTISGVPRSKPLKAHTRLASPADVLAHVRDYGAYCRKLEAIVYGGKALRGE